jgi:hypothetical protein
MKRWFVFSFAAVMVACGSGASTTGAGGDAGPDGTSSGSDASTDGATGGGPDGTAAEGAADATEDGATEDAADGSASCPSKQPRDGDACTGSASCQYGHTVCCGMSYSQFTCTCQQGSFSCAMTVECNIVCSEGGSDAGGG